LNYLCLEGKLGVEAFEKATSLAVQGAVTTIRAMRTFIQEDGLEKVLLILRVNSIPGRMSDLPPKHVSPAPPPRLVEATRGASGPITSYGSASWLEFDFNPGEEGGMPEGQTGDSRDRFAQTQSSSENVSIEFGTAVMEATLLMGEGTLQIVPAERDRGESSVTEMRRSLSTDWTQNQPSNNNTCSPIKPAGASEPMLSTILSKEWSGRSEDEEILMEKVNLSDLREKLRDPGGRVLQLINAATDRLADCGEDERTELVCALLEVTQATNDSHEVVKAVLMAVARAGVLAGRGKEGVAKLMEKVKNSIEGAEDLEELWRGAWEIISGKIGTMMTAEASVELPFGGRALLPILNAGHRLSTLDVDKVEADTTETERYSPESSGQSDGRSEGVGDPLDIIQQMARRGVEEGELGRIVGRLGVAGFVENLLTVVKKSPRHEIRNLAALLSSVALPGEGEMICAPVAGYPRMIEKELERFLPWFAPTELETREDTVEERKLKPPPPDTLQTEIPRIKRATVADPLSVYEDSEMVAECRSAVRKVVQAVAALKRSTAQVDGLGALAEVLRARRKALVAYIELVLKGQQKDKGQLQDITHPADIQQIPYPFAVFEALANPVYRGPPVALARAACLVAEELVGSTGHLAFDLLMKRLLPLLITSPTSVSSPAIIAIAELKPPKTAADTWRALVALKAPVEVMVQVGRVIADQVQAVRPWVRLNVVNALGVRPKVRAKAQRLVNGEDQESEVKKSATICAENGSVILPIVQKKSAMYDPNMRKEIDELKKHYEELHDEYVKVCGLLEKSNRAQLEHAAARAKAEKELSRARRSVAQPLVMSTDLSIVERMMMMLQEGSLADISRCFAELAVAISGEEDTKPSKDQLKMIFLAALRKACETRANELLSHITSLAVSSQFLESATVSEVQEILRCALTAMVFAPQQDALRALLAQVCSEVPPDVLERAWKRLDATNDFIGKTDAKSRERVKELLGRLCCSGA
ncbi:Exosome complex component RRP41, partial [Perkinsus chesapeaki]